MCVRKADVAILNKAFPDLLVSFGSISLAGGDQGAEVGRDPDHEEGGRGQIHKKRLRMDHHIPIHSSKWLTKSLPHKLNIFSYWIIRVVILSYGYRVNSHNGCTVELLL